MPFLKLLLFVPDAILLRHELARGLGLDVGCRRAGGEHESQAGQPRQGAAVADGRMVIGR